MNSVVVGVAKSNFRLFSPFHVALATFLGSPLAGAFLLYLNARRLEQPSAGNWFAAGLVTTAFLFLVGFALPQLPSSPVAMTGIVAMRFLASHYQGADIALNNKFESGWLAAGIGAVFLIAILAFVVPVAFALA